jgi:DNA-binding beta-propeller fold protein YncE
MRRRPWLSCNDLFTFAAMRRDHRWGRETTLACVVALGLACGLAQTAPAQANGAEACPAGLNLYAASATALSACGYHAVPRIALTHMPNGATESVYATPAGGGRVSFVTPPPSFDAAKASSAELELYGVPTEPAKDSPEYPKWKSMVEGGIHFVAPPEQLIEAPNAISPPPPPSLVEHSEGFETGSSPVWGGYLNTVPTGGEHAEEDAYTKATGYFQQPEAAGPECGEEPSSATWVGLGGWAANKSLGQAGAVQHWFFNGKLHQNEAFIEVTPGEEDFLKFSATPGYYMEAETQYLGEGKYHFYLYNYANHTAIAPKGAATEGEFDGETADYIVERQYGHNLFNFGKAVFQGYTNGKAFQNYPTERVDMENKKGENVRVSNISKKYEFTATFKNCEKPNSKEEIEIEEEVGKIKRQKLGTGYPAPKVTTGESSEVAGTAAKLNGTVNPEGDYTLYHFEYGTEADNFEGSSQVQVAGEGVKTVPVSATVSGLHTGTTYYDRLVAESGNGTRDGEERTFKTTGAPPPPPPTVTTEGTSGVGTHAAALEATVNPNGLDTHYYFQYGTSSTRFQSDAPASPGNDAGSGSTPVKVSVGLTGLTPYTTYYYRVVASNSTGTNYGTEKEFTTLFSPPTYSMQFGETGSGNGEFNGPTYDAVDGSGNLWVVDSGNNRVEEFSSTGAFIRAIGSSGKGNGQFERPTGIAINSATGEVYVADRNNNRIEEFSAEGIFIRAFGSHGTGNGQLIFPAGVAVEPNASGNVWVADNGNNRVEEFSSTGAFIAVYGSTGSGNGQFIDPQGVGIDLLNHIYIADYANERVEELGPEGAFLGQFGSSGSGNGQFTGPYGVASDVRSGAIFVTDESNKRVEVFSPSRAYLGTFGSNGTGNGEFVLPQGIATNPSGDIYVVDTGNNRVEKFLPGE